MNLEHLPIGKNPPHDINVIIEIATGGDPVKYEVDKESGLLMVDRVMGTPMRYPANYGFVPHTLGCDGDPLDALVVSQWPLLSGCVVQVRPIGVLFMEDQAGIDEKLLTVPVDSVSPYYSKVQTYEDMPQIITDQISHFFKHYKDLEPGKWVKIGDWAGPDEAHRLINEAIARAQETK